MKRKADGVEKVYEQVKKMAMEFSFNPGQKIKEGMLATEFGVSRTPVREALNRLTSEGFMSFIPNRGFFCRDIDLDEITQLYQIRAALEVWSFKLACENLSDAELDGFCEKWADGGDITLYDSLNVYDVEFHHQTAALSQNPLLLRQLIEISEKIIVFRNLDLENHNCRNMTMNEHKQIIAALAARNVEEGSRLLESHISDSAESAIEMAKLRISKHQRNS